MHSLLFFAVLLARGLALPGLQYFSYSPAVGNGVGTNFASESEGRVKVVRVWAIPNSYITGIQLRYDYIWSPLYGRQFDIVQELSLFDGEFIAQISGRYHSNYIYQLIFVTSRGRSLVMGHSYGRNFNFYPSHQDAELKLLSGRNDANGITTLAAHWGVTNSTDFGT